jgi:DNA-nicking Smr family endonuclease
VKTTGRPVRSLAELAPVKAALQLRQQEAARLAALHQQQLAKTQDERSLFQRAAGNVTALAGDGRSQAAPAPPAPVPRQHLRDEQAALAETLSDEFDVSTLLDIDDQLSFHRPGIGADVTAKLRKGHWSIQRQLDLHGLRSDAAREALSAFLREAGAQGVRCVRVIHGKGLGSPGKAPVLKHKVHAWLVQKKEVLAFVQARPAAGGSGALVVLLRAFQPP